MLLTIIISTYNWPEALKNVLLSLDVQKDYPFEVVIADDGSDARTKQMIDMMRQSMHFPIQHIWQEDKGFYVGMIRNKAIATSRGNFIVFIDHDCITSKHFVKYHYRYAEENHFVTFSRIHLNQDLTNQIINDSLRIYDKNFVWYLREYRKQQLHRLTPLLPIKLGPLRYLKKHSWKGTKNLIGVWKEDLVAVNGYDEAFYGWGYEDSDLVVRLLQRGIKRKSAKFGTQVFHLNHPENSRDQQQENWQRLQDRIAGKYTDCKGLDQYL